jgi:hypothetical protein
MVDRKHIRQCSHLKEFSDLQKPLALLKRVDIREWKSIDIAMTFLRFQSFKETIENLQA